MMGAREEILERITSALTDEPSIPEVPRTYRRSADLSGQAIEAMLVERLEDYQAHVDVVTTAGLPGTLETLLEEATGYVVPPGLPESWFDVDGLRVDERRITDGPGHRLSVPELDALSSVVTSSTVSVAESATIVLDGSGDQGRRAISLVPDQHVCIVPASSIVQILPEAMSRLEITRPLTWISGPSATSDIELERVEGVHGPRRLDVVIVTDL